MTDKLLLVLMMVLSMCQPIAAAHLHREKEYQDAWCAKVGGVTEFILDDGTRVDCLTDDYAIEFEFASKWAESVGQSLYYAERTGKLPGVVLIMEHESDDRFAKRLDILARKYRIKVWKVAPG
jgi:hypothetical protein